MSIIPFGMRVRVKATGKLGTIIPTSQFLREDGDPSVHFDGTDPGTSTTLLCLGGLDAVVVLGPENAQAGFECGLGKGRNCCIYLTLRGSDFVCQRRSSLGETLWWKAREGDSNAQRAPTLPFPHCINEMSHVREHAEVKH